MSKKAKKLKKTQREKIFDEYSKTKTAARMAELCSYDKNIAGCVQEIARDIALKVDDVDEYSYALEHITNSVAWVIDCVEDRKKQREVFFDTSEVVPFK